MVQLILEVRAWISINWLPTTRHNSKLSQNFFCNTQWSSQDSKAVQAQRFVKVTPLQCGLSVVGLVDKDATRNVRSKFIVILFTARAMCYCPVVSWPDHTSAGRACDLDLGPEPSCLGTCPGRPGIWIHYWWYLVSVDTQLASAGTKHTDEEAQ